MNTSDAAHAQFLASLPPPDPILAQLQTLSQQYTQPVTRVTPVVPIPDDEVGQMTEDGLHEAVSEEVFSNYRHRKIVAASLPHPGDIVEAGPLAAIRLPKEYYPITDSYPKEVIEGGRLSSLQLEGIIHACQRHTVILANKQRAGFFIGDGAGVGKGRQIAGIIMDNFVRGRTKHVWFTISTDLIVDSRRDLSDIGCYIKVIDGCQELDRETRVLGLPSDFKEGVIFSTYATLVSSVQRGGAFSTSRQSRLQQLIDWCGGTDFQGCLIFDECHKAKNFIPNKEQASTKIAVAVTSIQRMLPKARVVYCSATGVTDVKNMAFMERLGLWGDGAPFKTFEHFMESVQKKGLGVAEMLAMEMKASGMYVSRGLSFKQAEFVTVQSELSKEHKKMYDAAAHVWNELRKALESALLRTGNVNKRLWSQFWSAHQRFFKQLCMGMKVPCIVKEAKEALESGCCVVIGLQTTGEASLDSELNKNKGRLKGFISLCREIISRFIEQYFPTKIENAGNSVEDEWSMKAKSMLLEFCRKIPLPDSPLDEIIDRLGGPDNVAEMTGRKGRVVKRTKRDVPQYEQRGHDSDSFLESLNVKERNMFMEGKKLVAIISDAASTGISLHADMRAANQRRRVHLTVELPWSADKAVQQLGRSHRSNQSSGPLYKLLTTNLGGERRFAAAVARRLQSLGALTKGDRRAATGADLTEFNFDTPYGRSALRSMYHCICQKKLVPGVSLSKMTNGVYDFDELNMLLQESLVLMGLVEVDVLRLGATVKDKDAGDVSKFLNRILGLSVEKQNLMFNYFTETLGVIVQSAKKEGRYNEGMLDITAASVNMVEDPKEVFKDFAKGGGSTKSIQLVVDRGMSWEAALIRLNNYKGRQDGFYVSKRDIWGSKHYILATQKESSTHLFKIARPNTGLSTFDEEKTDLLHKYVPIQAEKAEEGWKKHYDQSRDLCIHGRTCRHHPHCTVGSRTYPLHLLCGNIVTLMSVLETTINKFALKLGLSKYDTQLRVVRVELDNGERLVGIRYPEVLIQEVQRSLKEQHIFMQQSLPAMNLSACQTQPTTHHAVVAKEDSAKQFKVIKEDVTPVVPKCFARAINPPITLKNFFKPVSKLSNEECVASVSSQHTGELEDVSTDIIVKVNETKVRRTEDKLQEKDAVGFEIEEKNLVTYPKKVQPSDLISRARTKKEGRTQKRLSCGSSTQPAKRSKQVSLFSSFAKQTSLRDDKREMNCPVCGRDFPTGTSNETINHHVDNCLIN
ncbi:protein FORGETTER 1-like isoform X2 [Haliotis rufescens]|nr:protein FORGETTER 1-like isoform X2 [Haliotis rufescens]